MATNNNLAKSNDDVSYLSVNNNNHRDASLVKRSLDQESLIDNSRSRSNLHHRRLRKKFHPIKLNNSPNIFQSKGTHKKNLRSSKRIHAIVDDRLKRFRMLDPDEFQDMLNSLNQQTPDEQPKEFNSMDTIAGMQLESKSIYNS